MPVIPCQFDHELHLVLLPNVLAEAVAEDARFVPHHADEVAATLNSLSKSIPSPKLTGNEHGFCGTVGVLKGTQRRTHTSHGHYSTIALLPVR